MGRKLYVGNLPFSATEASLREAFSASGTVDTATVITDRDTGQSKGFGFVEMSTDQEAQAATQAMNGTSLDGRQIKVSEAKPKPSGGGGGGWQPARQRRRLRSTLLSPLAIVSQCRGGLLLAAVFCCARSRGVEISQWPEPTSTIRRTAVASLRRRTNALRKTRSALGKNRLARSASLNSGQARTCELGSPASRESRSRA